MTDADILDTGRFRLRPLREDSDKDRTLYCALYTSPGVMARIMPPLSMAAAGRLYERALQWARSDRPGHRFWMIDSRIDGAAIGVAGYVRRGAEAEIGVLLVEPWWQRGVSSEVFVPLIAHGFERMGLTLVTAERPDDDHARVIDRLLGRFGFVRTPDRASAPGQCRWELPCSAWKARQPAV
ncbi:GNAT family N-acetyltransferase [Marilutibacter chinensis]|uniref:GNAT family N-acetyltransferase n=1 Tax=Marilutibacter chinensis TaxID=2912247 RepID=A0ABS9HTU2_9GAMM|nr:GNAT family N-acetyltransferase [Lysobacter chinensis]MCF7221790.1 GNAT family N-acetyltransferase [Lysobacter chinensis]MCF7223726.1 GNAT family N-acetyltransferase [Lysobacter chinensis]